MWNKEFLARLFRLSLPIMLQSLFGVLGGIVTTLMTGQLGDVSLAALGLANQLYFILSLVQFGVGSGASIFTAQFWGRRDEASISKVLGVSLIMGFVVSFIFMAVALFFPRVFLGIFTTDQAVIDLGEKILRVIGWSYFFTPITLTIYMILRSIGNVRLPMAISSSSVILNVILGYLIIFGGLGLPAQGALGAAYANLIARILECVLLVWLVYYLKTPLAVKPATMFSFDGSFSKKILGKVMPVAVNELFWSVGISVYNAVYARISTEAIAAYNIRSSIEDLVFVPFLGVIHACAIMVGNAIGSGQKEKSADYVKQSIRVILIMAVFFGVLIIAGRDFITTLYNVSELTASYARGLLLVLGLFLWVRTINTHLFIGMMRAGGDTRFAYFMDVGSIWLIGVPCALLAAFVFKLPVVYVYPIVMIDEVVKFFISIWRFRSNRWVHNLVAE